MAKLEPTPPPLGTRLAGAAKRAIGRGPKDISLPAEGKRDPRLPASPADGFRRAGEGLKEITKKFPTTRSMRKR